jgi:hypothetical protein
MLEQLDIASISRMALVVGLWLQIRRPAFPVSQQGIGWLMVHGRPRRVCSRFACQYIHLKHGNQALRLDPDECWDRLKGHSAIIGVWQQPGSILGLLDQTTIYQASDMRTLLSAPYGSTHRMSKHLPTSKPMPSTQQCVSQTANLYQSVFSIKKSA